MEAVPLTAFLRANRLGRDAARINDAARGKWLSIVGMALAVARNYDPFQVPTHLRMLDLLRKFDKTFGATGRNYGYRQVVLKEPAKPDLVQIGD